MYTLLSLVGLMLCYNTTTMKAELLDYPNYNQRVILSEQQRDRLDRLQLDIYEIEGLTDYGLYVCLTN